MNDGQLTHLVQLAIRRGRVNELRDEEGNTLLHVIEEPSLIKLLLENGADVNARNDIGETPLHIKTNPTSIKHLIKAGANLNAKTRAGETPLFYHCFEDLLENVKILLKNGADVNVQNKKGENVLFKTKNPRMIRLLLEHGADVNLKNRNGITPLEIDYDDQSFSFDMEFEKQRVQKITQQNQQFLRNQELKKEFGKIQQIRKKLPYGSRPKQASGGGGRSTTQKRSSHQQQKQRNQDVMNEVIFRMGNDTFRTLQQMMGTKQQKGQK